MFDLHAIAPDALPVPAAADPWPLVLRVRKGQLRDAFRTVAPCAGKQLLLRLGPEEVTLRGERMARGAPPVAAAIMWVEARVPLLDPVPIEAATVLDLCVGTDLFSDFLCRPDLHDVSVADRKRAPNDHFVVRVSRADATPSGPGPVHLKVADAAFRVRRPGRFAGVGYGTPRAPGGVSLVPGVLVDALQAVLAFTRRSQSDPSSFPVTVRDGQVRLVRQGLWRVVELAGLGSIDLCLTSEGAAPLAETLARFVGETRLLTLPDSYSFLSATADCGVVRHRHTVDPLPEASCAEGEERLTVEEGAFLDALNGILYQPDRIPATLRVCVDGGRTGTLRLPVAVDAGEATITCPVTRERCTEGGDAHPACSALVETQFLSLLTRQPNAQPTEIVFLEKSLSITQTRDGCRARTLVARRERQRP